MTALALWKGAVQPPAKGWDRDVIRGGNLCNYSENLDGGGWVENSTVFTVDNIEGPDGNTSGDLITDNGAGGGSGNVYARGPAMAFSASSVYTMSVYAKQGNNQWGHLNLVNYPTNYMLWFDLQNGVLGTTQANIITAGIEAATETYPNAPAGWYRIWATFLSDGTDVSGNFRFGPSAADGNNTVTRDGTNTIYCWGFQMQPGGLTDYSARTTTDPGEDRDRTEATTLAAAPGNVIYMYKGAVQPAKTYVGYYGATALTGIKYPRDSMATEEQRFKDFITAAGIAQNDDLQDNYKAALAATLGLDPDLYSIDDLFKRYWESL